jgi:hypothetical protein
MVELYIKGDNKFTTLRYAPYAYNINKAKRLWSDLLKLVGLPNKE